MAEKFGRSGSLSLEVAPDGTGASQNLTIPADLRIEFDISRGSLSSPQNGHFRVHNLSEATRGLIFKDPFAITTLRALQFRAGYQNITPLIFNGTVASALSEHPSGAEDDITEIIGYDGAYGMVNGYTSGWGAAGQAVPPGTTAQQILEALGAPSALPGVTALPIVGNFPTANMRGEVLFGNTWDIIQKKSNGFAIIDNGQVKALGQNEALAPEGAIPVFDSSTGLLGSPRRSGAFLEWDILFEPRLTVFQLVQIVSIVNPTYSGVYKVMGFRHRGVIDRSDDGPYQTTISVYSGYGPLNGSTNSPFTPVSGATPQ